MNETAGRRTGFGARNLRAALPWWAAVLVGLACVVIGLVLVGRPLTSVTLLAVVLGVACVLTGVADLLDARRSATPRTGVVLGVLWIGFGLVVLVWLAESIELLAPAFGIALLVGGALRLVRAVRGGVDQRLAAGIFAVAELVLGVLALRWLDLTLLAVALLFGVRTLVFGVALLIDGVSDAVARLRTGRDTSAPDRSGEPTGAEEQSERPASGGTREDIPEGSGSRDSTEEFGRERGATGPAPRLGAESLGRREKHSGPSGLARFGKVAVAVVALAVAVAAAAVGAHVRQAAPTVDAFYDAPAEVPTEPGVLLRAEPFTRGIPADADAWRILYTTTRDDDEPTLASGLVMVPKQPSPAPRPVIAWAHGTTGYARHCAPTVVDDPLTAGALPARQQLLAEGWALVATDYAGMGTAGPQPYLIGQGEGRSVLDAVRAAHSLGEIQLSDQTVVWGHSQGGHAALWAGLLAPTYAPDVEVRAVAAVAPAADIIGLTRHLPDVTGGSVFASYVAAAYADTYPDVDLDTYIIPAARTLVREMSTRCLSEPGILASVLSALSISRDHSIFRTDPTTGPFGDRLTANIPTGPMTVPVLLAQGSSDPLVEPTIQDAYAAARCGEDWELDYRVYPGRDHMGVVADDSPLIPQLIEWTTQRLDAAAPTPTC
ncbi:lipase family protein [Nocardia sp. NPDC058176]|uniref:lipase family protein n=1 Tax=Nocardia sp. NPDC058176 TaxID=3346368 RepID=UPI0036D8F8A6